MKKELLTPEELLQLEFQEIAGDTLDNNGYYRWWAFYKNNSELHLTYEYDANDTFLLGYFEFNGEQLKGREITIEDINFLIELM